MDRQAGKQVPTYVPYTHTYILEADNQQVRQTDRQTGRQADSEGGRI